MTVSPICDAGTVEVKGANSGGTPKVTRLSGKVTASAQLKIRGVTIAEHTCHLAAATDISLDEGVPLLSGSDVTRDSAEVTTSPHPDLASDGPPGGHPAA